MASPIQLILDAQIRPGKQEAFQALSQAIPAFMQAAEPNTLESRWVVQEGGDRVLMMDVYASSSALLQHVQNLQTSGHMDAIRDCLDLLAVHCIGAPNARARLVLGEWGTLFYHAAGGFARPARSLPLAIVP